MIFGGKSQNKTVIRGFTVISVEVKKQKIQTNSVAMDEQKTKGRNIIREQTNNWLLSSPSN